MIRARRKETEDGDLNILYLVAIDTDELEGRTVDCSL